MLGGLVAVPVLRAGLGMLEAVIDLFPEAAVGYVGLERDEMSLEPQEYYAKLPPVAGRQVLVLDPMLATGGSGRPRPPPSRRAAPDDPVRVRRRRPRGHRSGWRPTIPTCRSSLPRSTGGSTTTATSCRASGDFGDRLFGTE